jgi:transcriptional regulator with XRE-family HTH domain
MPNPSSQLFADWQDLVQKHEVPGIDTDPAEELSAEEIRGVNRAYERSGAAGRQRLLEAFRGHLQTRIDTFKKSASEAAKLSSRAELENAEQRKGPLQALGEEKAEMFGANLDLVYNFLEVTYDELSAVTGISRSTLHTFIREKPAPSLGSVYQVAVSLGVHPTVLLAGYPELKSWDGMVDQTALPSEIREKSLQRTTGPMGKLLRAEVPTEAEAAVEKGGPAEWLSRAEWAARRIAPYCPSPGGAIGAVIGRHHGGMKGAGIAAALAHGLRSAAQEPNLEGFRYPGPFVEHCLQLKLRDRYWG